MKIFANKKIWKKLVIALIVITMVGFMAPKPVAAGIGGSLMEPICDLLIGICDGIINVIHNIILRQDTTLIKISLLTDVESIFRVIGAVLAAVVVATILFNVAGVGLALFKLIGEGALASYLSGVSLIQGFELLILKGLEAGATSIFVVSLLGGGFAGFKSYNSNKWGKELYVPIYSISPEEIFKAEIPLFNVNFFNPESGKINYDWLGDYDFKGISYSSFIGPIEKPTESGIITQINQGLKDKGIDLNVSTIMNSQWSKKYTEANTDQTIWYYIIKDGTGAGTYKLIRNIEKISSAAEASTYKYELLKSDTIAPSYSESGEMYGASYQLKNVVENWYYVLFTIAVVGMMSVLVYIGIRILLTSTAPQKAKYKQMLGDWGIGMVLLFTMTFIMVLANFFVDKLTNIFNAIQPNIYYQYLQEDSGGKIEKALKNYGFDITTDPNMKDDYQTVLKYTTQQTEDNENKKVTVFQMRSANLMGQLRYETQYNRKEVEAYIGYTVLFMVMTIYLIMFVWTYLRRVIYMAFLTIISPLVALTYPIDKATDGQAQGFNIWFKEYTFNLLIQPLHLLLYTVLISSAGKLATANMIYAVVAMGFMIPAEQLLRKMFNFQKADTPGLFGGFAGGALVMSGMRWLMGRGPKGGRGGSGNSGEKEEANDLDGFKDPNAKMNFAAIEEDNNFPKNNNEVTNNTQRNNYRPGDYSTYSENDLKYQIDQLAPDDGKLMAKDQTKLNQMRDEWKRREEEKQKQRQESINELANNTNSNTKSHSFGRAIRNFGDSYSSSMKKKMRARLKKSNPVRFTGKMALRGIGGATLGMVGLAAGVSSGNAGNTAKYAGAGVAGGFKIGGNTYDSIDRNFDPGNAGKEAFRSYIGEEEYQKMMSDKKLKEAQENEEYIRKIEKQFKKDRIDAKAKLKEMTEAYYGMGETDFDKMVEYEKAYDKAFNNEADGKGREKAAITGKVVEQFGLNSQLEKEKWLKRQQRAEELYDGKLSKGQINKIFKEYAPKYISVKESMKG